MSYTYSTPTDLTGTAAGDTINLTWVAPSLLVSPTVLLWHFDGNYLDSSPSGNNATAFGTTALSNTYTSPVGDTDILSTPSATINGNVCYAAVSGSNGLDLANVAAWTIEFFIYVPSAGPATSLCAIGWATDGSSGFNGVRFGTGSAAINFTASVEGGVTAPGIPFTQNFSYGAWHHIAFVKAPNVGGPAGDMYQIFCDGVGAGWSSNSSPYTGPYTDWQGYFCLNGYYSGPGGYNAFMNSGFQTYWSEVRITSGEAVYTSDFTPPTSPFLASPPPPGYDIYLGGVSSLVYTGSPGRGITVPGPGTYTFNVAASDGVSTDLSAQSSPFTISIGGQAVYKAIMVANPGSINPRIYPPQIDSTVRVTPPRITS